MLHSDKRIPVTVITGFLGAGKTSFINETIKKDPDKNIAIIENEFGDISIDNDLLKGINQNKIYNITSGCICCSVKTEFVDLLDNYLNTFKKLDHLIIETTGIADPQSVILPFYADYGLQLNFALKNLICLVDAVNYQNTSKNYRQIENQITVADKIVINKIDLVSENTIEQMKDNFMDKNPLAMVYTSVHGNISSDIFDENNIIPVSLKQKLRPGKTSTENHPDVQSETFTTNKLFKSEDLIHWLKTLIEDNDIIRIKGIVYSDKSPFKMIVQSVQDLLVVSPVTLNANENKTSRIVFMGKDLNILNISKTLDSFAQ